MSLERQLERLDGMIEIPSEALRRLNEAARVMSVAGALILIAHILPWAMMAGAAVVVVAESRLRWPTSLHVDDVIRTTALGTSLTLTLLQGAALLWLSRRPKDATWRVVALAALAVTLLLSPIGLGLGLLTCGLGSLLHGLAAIFCIAGLVHLLHRSVSLGLTEAARDAESAFLDGADDDSHGSEARI